MAKYRHDLPQRRGGIFLTDGGMETTLIFHHGLELPHFAAFVLLDSADGRLVKGETLREAIEAVDHATQNGPEYFLINCAHPSHFAGALSAGDTWAGRIHGVRANASAKSHQELDESETLDAGDPTDLGRRYVDLRRSFPGMHILGGCCGTDHRHVAAICEACI